MINLIRRQLRWKLFLTYLIIILIGAIILLIMMEVALPRAFANHLATVGNMGDPTHMNGMHEPGQMMDDLFIQFRTAVTEATIIALTVAAVIAALISAFISRRLIAPVQAMMHASRQIARGHYGEQIPLPINRSPDELDEMGQLAHSFNQMSTQLETAENVRRQLIGDVTHELTTPLTVIKGSMEGLIDGVLAADPQTYQLVAQEAERLQRLVIDLQELSRIESGTYQLHYTAVDLGELTQKLVSYLGHQFDDKGVALQLHLPPGLLLAEVDKDRISQLLINLIGNALQYTPAGGCVDLTLQREENRIQFTIADTGIGITPEHLPNLFTRFYRVDKSRARTSGGSGVGLTIARHLVHAHGGNIWANSAGLDQGSQFHFFLPLSAKN